MASIICYYNPDEGFNGWGAWISKTGASGTWSEIPSKLVADDGVNQTWAMYSTKKEAKEAALHMWNVKYGAEDYLDRYFADYDDEHHALAA
jgi:hypothetical protein